jgi:(2Fe-2S) ferredoxin
MNSPETKAEETLSQCVEKLGIPQIQRHIFLCCDQTKPKCCPKEVGLQTWEYLKSRLQELGLDKVTQDNPHPVFRTKANCLRVCDQGPILVVYPEGVWYKNVTTEAIEEIIQEHLINNRIVKEYAFLTHPLPPVSLAEEDTVTQISLTPGITDERR